MQNPFLGVFLHAVGGFSAGSFYLPLKKINQWSWESGWLVNGVFSWLLAPWIVAFITVPDLLGILSKSDFGTVSWTYFFGVLWGVGGLTFGLTMRYLGIGLGMSIALGLTAVFGTLVPPIYDGSIDSIMNQFSGQVVIFGVVVSLIGIGICALAGARKDAELSESQKVEGVKEFNLKKGIIVALFAGVMSSCFAFGIQAGKPLAEAASLTGTQPLWVNGPVFIMILFGGATTNLTWCLVLNIKNGTYRDYINKDQPLLRNYLFSTLAGAIWYCQYMFYGMGTTQMGKHDFASWSIHMAFIIIFSTLWGFVTREWSGVGRKTLSIVVAGLFILILSTVIIGYGNSL